jgi:hypothetical protein
VLWEQADAPGADRTQVDALLRGLARPLAAGEDARARADLLHYLIADARVGQFRGSNGLKVSAAATRALLVMGHPYALELSPEALDAMRQAEREARATRAQEGPQPATREPPPLHGPQQHVGFWLTLVMALIETLFALGIAGSSGSVPGLLFVVFTGFMPTLVLATEEGVRNRLLHYLCLLLAILPGLGWLGVAGIIWIMDGYKGSSPTYSYLLPLAGALARFIGMYCQHAPAPRARATRPPRRPRPD